MTRKLRLCALEALVEGQATRIDIEGHRIAVAMVDGQVFAIGDRCSHANFSLAEGYLSVDGCSLECPKHGSSFSLTTGQPDSLPAIKPVPVYDVSVEGDDVVVVLPDEEG